MTADRIRLSIVFLNFNRLEETRYTIDRLHELLRGRGDVEIIAIDNNSEDGTGEYLLSRSDILIPILLQDNRGIAGYTPGFERAQGDYLLVLDDDSHPGDRGTIEQLIHYLDTHPETGVVACRIEDPDGERFSSWHLPPLDQPGPSMSFVGCGFAIRRDLFRDIGWYPEQFFLYQNEIDVAMQIYLRGFDIHYEPECRVIHRATLANRPGARRVFFATRNTLWIIRKYYTWPGKAYLLVSRIIISLVRAIQFAQINMYLRALHQGLGGSVERQVLPRHLRSRFTPFWKQNSLWHQLTRST